MLAFEIKNNIAKKITQKCFSNEIELHKLIDNNLTEIFGISFIKDEHITDKHGRIETLGLDESNRPVVIEYKMTKEKGHLVQANRYMLWIKNNPDSFELLVKKNLGDSVKYIDFANPRIICFAQEYNIDDKCLALTIGAELWKYRYYDNGVLIITKEEEPEQLIKSKKLPQNIDISIQKQKTKKLREPKSIDEHLNNCTTKLKDLFYAIDSRIFDISSEIERYTTYSEILYKTSRNFACLAVQKNKNNLRIYLRTINDEIHDPKNITKKVPEHFGYGNITRVIYISPEHIENKMYSIDDIMELILQSYNTTQ